MNDFGIFWFATAMQVSVVILAGAVIQAMAARRSAVTASWIAAVTLGLVVVLPLASCMPWRIGLEMAPVSGDLVSSAAGSGASDRAGAAGLNSVDSHRVVSKVTPSADRQGWSQEPIPLGELFKGTTSCVLGVAGDDAFSVKILATCADVTASEATAATIDQLIQLARVELSKPGEISPGIDRDRALKSLELIKQLVSSMRLTRDGTTVTVSTSQSLRLADLVWLLVYGQEEPERPELPSKP